MTMLRVAGIVLGGCLFSGSALAFDCPNRFDGAQASIDAVWQHGRICRDEIRSRTRRVDMGARVLVRSVDGARFTQEVEAGKHRLLADEPESFGGNDRGPGPYEWLLAGLGT